MHCKYDKTPLVLKPFHPSIILHISHMKSWQPLSTRNSFASSANPICRHYFPLPPSPQPTRSIKRQRRQFDPMTLKGSPFCLASNAFTPAAHSCPYAAKAPFPIRPQKDTLSNICAANKGKRFVAVHTIGMPRENVINRCITCSAARRLCCLVIILRWAVGLQGGRTDGV